MTIFIIESAHELFNSCLCDAIIQYAFEIFHLVINISLTACFACYQCNVEITLSSIAK